MKNSPSTQTRARLVALDMIAFVMRAAGVGLFVALALAGAALLFSSQAEAAHVEDALVDVRTAAPRETTPSSIPPLSSAPGTSALARLSVPQLGIEREVHASASDARSRFGARHMAGTALPGEAGNSVIGDHCDMQLAFLRETTIGTEILVEARAGAPRRYVVRYAQFLERGDVWVLKQEGPARLTLITCSPSDARRAGSLQRYAVSAYALDDMEVDAERAGWTEFSR